MHQNETCLVGEGEGAQGLCQFGTFAQVCHLMSLLHALLRIRPQISNWGKFAMTHHHQRNTYLTKMYFDKRVSFKHFCKQNCAHLRCTPALERLVQLKADTKVV